MESFASEASLSSNSADALQTRRASRQFHKSNQLFVGFFRLRFFTSVRFSGSA
jgi:hypothetical protein